MAIQKVLLPYNFTTYEGRALDFITTTFADKKDVTVTLFHTYIPLPEIDMKASPEMRKMREGLVSLTEELRKKEAGLKASKEFLMRNGFSDDQIDYIFKKRKKAVADEIVDCASQGGYDVIVLTPQRGKVSRLFTRSVHAKLLSSLTNVTICLTT
jgi:hypothetical protein